jgi:hypothetical protein
VRSSTIGLLELEEKRLDRGVGVLLGAADRLGPGRDVELGPLLDREPACAHRSGLLLAVRVGVGVDHQPLRKRRAWPPVADQHTGLHLQVGALLQG